MNNSGLRQNLIDQAFLKPRLEETLSRFRHRYGQKLVGERVAQTAGNRFTVAKPAVRSRRNVAATSKRWS